MKPRRSRDRQDYYYWEAKKKGYRSRAAFKLLQMNRTFGLIKNGYAVLDLGASPGGWSQVAVELGAEGVSCGSKSGKKQKSIYTIKFKIRLMRRWSK